MLGRRRAGTTGTPSMTTMAVKAPVADGLGGLGSWSWDCEDLPGYIALQQRPGRARMSALDVGGQAADEHVESQLESLVRPAAEEFVQGRVDVGELVGRE
jgi:hypothetical protein